MNKRELQLLISMVEDAYESENYTSFAASVYRLTSGFTMSDEQLFRTLKREHRMNPTGMIRRVVSKRVYDICERTDQELVSVIESACQRIDMDAINVSDDMLCRQLE